MGTFVREGVDILASTPSLGLLADLRRQAAHTVVDVVEIGPKAAPTAIAKVLGLDTPAKAVYVVRVRRIESTPTMLTEAWIPAAHGRGVTAAALRKRPLYEVLQAQGVRFGRVVQEITAVPTDPSRAHLLKLGVGMPLLKMVRLMHDLNEQPILHISIYLPPDYSRVLMDIPAEAINTMSAGQIIHPTIAGRSARK